MRKIDLRLPPGADGRCGDWKPGVAKFLHQLQLVCRFPRLPKTDPTMLLRFDDCEETAHTEYILVVNSSHVNNRLFEATFVRMVLAGMDPPPAIGQAGRAPPHFSSATTVQRWQLAFGRV